MQIQTPCRANDRQSLQRWLAAHGEARNTAGNVFLPLVYVGQKSRDYPLQPQGKATIKSSIMQTVIGSGASNNTRDTASTSRIHCFSKQC